MKNDLYREMYEAYKQGYSLSEVGRMYGMTRQSVYSGFKCRGYGLRGKKKLPFLMFMNIRFTLRNNGYYRRTDSNRCLMHRYVWEHFKGNIPNGYEIHHIDHDRTNNNIENLELYTKSDHARKFSCSSNQYVKREFKVS